MQCHADGQRRATLAAARDRGHAREGGWSSSHSRRETSRRRRQVSVPATLAPRQLAPPAIMLVASVLVPASGSSDRVLSDRVLTMKPGVTCTECPFNQMKAYVRREGNAPVYRSNARSR